MEPNAWRLLNSRILCFLYFLVLFSGVWNGFHGDHGDHGDGLSSRGGPLFLSTILSKL